MAKLKGMFFGGIFMVMTKFEFLRKFMISNPELVTGGMFSKAGPNEEQRKNSTFKWEIIGYGVDKGNTIRTRVSGRDPGYEETAAMCAAAAVTLLEDRELMPGKGGVMTTAYAFRGTKLEERLNENSIKFAVI